MIVLVLGGARSGKSRHGEALARRSGGARIYVATAEAFDEEMAQRIAHHRATRGQDWTTLDAPRDLGATLLRHARADRAILVDCLTLWLSNVMLAGEDAKASTDALCITLGGLPGTIILVSNEIGMGLVPETPLGRAFRDAQGRLNQVLAALADHVHFVAAGLPLALKGAHDPFTGVES